MARIWVKEFSGGLDSRRMPEATEGGVLLVARDGHISRGGEFEKRAAFVPSFTLPPGTLGLAQTANSLVVFGSDPAPAMPNGVVYQRLQHPSAGIRLSRVLSYDLYAGKVYVAAEFVDGRRFHFYDGVRVADWFDGRARAAFTVVTGESNIATPSQATIKVTAGTSAPANRIDAIIVNGVSITSGAPILHTGDNATTAAAVATAINGVVTSPDYTAVATGNAVKIQPVAAGAYTNTFPINITVSGDVIVTGDTELHDGSDAGHSTLDDLTIDDVSILSGPIGWVDTAANFATALADAINSFNSTPNYTAKADTTTATVTIIAPTSRSDDNGKKVVATVSNGLKLSGADGLTLSGGVDDGSDYQPGTFVKTIGSKMYTVSGPNEHFSGIQQPTKWTTDYTGAGFIDMSTQASGSETLYALAKYNKYVAIFAGKTTQIWYMDPDPTQNQQVQVLNNTGTFSPRSVTQFGDNDLFYLDDSGLRSLRARDSSNAAATTDVGVPIDTLLIAKLKTLTLDDRLNIFGVIEPQEGRFWLAIFDTIYVFSFFSGAKISAWSTYVPGFNVDAMTVHKQRVCVRSGNEIYVYGGLGADIAYDETEAEAWLPYLTGGDPTKRKHLIGIDAALMGKWEVSIGTDPTNLGTAERVATFDKTTYTDMRMPVAAQSTHFSPRFKSKGAGPAKLASVVLHHDPDDEEDDG